MSIIQQLEDLKEWAQNPERYERRLAFRSNNPMGTEAGTIPIEWDELSDREQEYYRTGPWSTREDYSKGQLVQPGQPGVRQGYQGPPGKGYYRGKLITRKGWPHQGEYALYTKDKGKTVTKYFKTLAMPPLSKPNLPGPGCTSCAEPPLAPRKSEWVLKGGF